MGVSIGDNVKIIGDVSITGNASIIKITHKCATCKLCGNGCPKSERLNKTILLYRKHLDLFFKEFDKWPKDEKHKKYTLEFQEAPNIKDCPYYR